MSKDNPDDNPYLDGSYLLRGYGVEDFIEAFETAYKEQPEVYWYMLSILRKQGFRVSEEDMKYLAGTPAPLKIMIPIVIEKPCKDCGFYHPNGTCLDS